MENIELLLILSIIYVVYEFFLKDKIRPGAQWVAGAVFPSFVFTIMFALVTLPFLQLTIFWFSFLSVLFMFGTILTELTFRPLKLNLWFFGLKQVIHWTTLFIFWIVVTDQWFELQQSVKSFSGRLPFWLPLLIALAYLFILHPTSKLIRILLNPWISEINEEDSGNANLANAGKLIGFLERTAVLTMILLNQFAAIGFILAAKSVFRFGDLRDDQGRKLTEYVLLGTFSSFVITLFVGLAVKGILYFAHPL